MPPGIPAVVVAGERPAALLGEAGFVDVAIATATEVVKEGRRYAIFLATAARPAAAG